MNDHRDDEPRDGQPNWPTGGDPDSGNRGPQGGAPGTPPGGTPATPNGPQRGAPGRPPAGRTGGPGGPVGGPGGPRQGGPGRPPGPGGPRGQVRPGGFGPGTPNQGPADRATDHLPPVPDPSAKYRPEPNLLTHRDDDYLQDAEARDHYRDAPAGLTEDEARQLKHRRAWRWVRRVLYVLIFLGVTGPIAAFYLIYQNVTVPDPKTVAFGQAQPITYYYADGTVMDKISTNARIFINANTIPVNVRRAVEAAEDETFETNNGFDIKAIARTAYNQLTGGTGGGSTITQEYIKVATGNNQHSISRKVNEAVEAYKMTKTYTNKNDILAAYLNTVYFGRGAYGIESAARLYYNVKAADLSPQQASLLAGMIQLPGDANIPSYQHRRFTYVWGRMLANHWITDAQFKAGAFPTPLPLAQTQQQSIPWDRQLIVNQVDQELANAGWSSEALKAQGAQIYTTIDPKAMTDAENSIASHLATDTQFTNGQPLVLNGRAVTNTGGPVAKGNPQVKGTETAALVSINPTNGEIVAYYGGNDQKTTEIDSANTPHQAGSSFKPYVLAAGLEYQPDKIGLNAIFDTKAQTIQGVPIHNADGDTCPSPCTVKDAMTNSINVVFYLMGQQVGSERVRDAALQAGIAPTEVIGNTKVPSLSEPGSKAASPTVHGGIAIGQYEVRPLDQAQGYATFANNGMYIQAHFVRKVIDTTGQRTLVQFSKPPAPAFGTDPTTSARIARTVSDSMSDVATGSHFALAKGRPADAKTGTQDFSLPNSKAGTNYNSQAWTIGFTPQLVTAVWFGHYDTPGPIFGRGNGGGSGTYNVFGRMEPGSIWKTFMDTYLGDQPVQQFPTAPPEVGGSWDFVHNVDASTENTPNTTAPPPPSNQPPQQTSDQPTQPPTDTTTKRHGPPPTSTVCNPLVQQCPPGLPTG